MRAPAPSEEPQESVHFRGRDRHRLAQRRTAGEVGSWRPYAGPAYDHATASGSIPRAASAGDQLLSALPHTRYTRIRRRRSQRWLSREKMIREGNQSTEAAIRWNDTSTRCGETQERGASATEWMLRLLRIFVIGSASLTRSSHCFSDHFRLVFEVFMMTGSKSTTSYYH